ncbi:MAG TPA: hypothetical protein H9701_02115 [Candidatus Intestinimonas pullistercoris]|uniref:Uncharacterized protein n=1 Tax=Candidatus Intestinimonas pullistercoris TaxID=2838623 RepID=A0A9D2SZS0_9FIRM|nr:hypothetical protein [uncultured Intestinimonas sp.]HJC40334.1 hypothetical protein [Candidatus Intestinimonas pullistercoris]
MNNSTDHPVLGVCIVIFALSMALLYVASSFFWMELWVRILLSLILTALGGGLYALLRRVRRLEEQVALLRDQLWRLDKHQSQTSED